MKEDKDLEILQRICQCRRFSGVYTDVECIFKAIENLIARYKELDNKNKSLKKEIDLMKSININDNFIPKSKVQEKIEEIKNTGIDVAWEQINYSIKEQDKAKIQVLKELLEES